MGKKKAMVRAGDLVGDLHAPRLPKGAKAEAALMLIKTNKGWFSRAAGGKAYQPLEFLGQLTALTHNLVGEESKNWS